jgi:hypothetical protein
MSRRDLPKKSRGFVGESRLYKYLPSLKGGSGSHVSQICESHAKSRFHHPSFTKQTDFKLEKPALVQTRRSVKP